MSHVQGRPLDHPPEGLCWLHASLNRVRGDPLDDARIEKDFDLRLLGELFELLRRRARRDVQEAGSAAGTAHRENENRESRHERDGTPSESLVGTPGVHAIGGTGHRSRRGAARSHRNPATRLAAQS